MKRNVLVWVEAAIIAALSISVVLDSGLCWVVYTVVGDNCSCYFSLRRGLTPGLTAGLLWGLLHFAVGKYTSCLLNKYSSEYIIAFAVMGLAGLLYSPFQKR